MYKPTDVQPERAILMAVFGNSAAEREACEHSLDELAALAEACRAVVVGRVSQNRAAPDGSTYIGKGKLEEIKAAAAALEADLLISDDELSGSQLRNIERLTGMRTIDRTMLILDIFAKRAVTREGKWEVELAQYQYKLPRLHSESGRLSRLGGGIGTRGPGETKLESDRRYIRRRISALRKNLADVAAHRVRLRASRAKRGTFSIAVVGYTNAGKSTLINRLCESELFAADQVFATLDSSVRRLWLPGDAARRADTVLIDTIGFINKLPHQLIDSFKSTLDETVHADLILLLVDGSDPAADMKLQTTLALLDELKAIQIPRVTIVNKTDRINESEISPAVFSSGRNDSRLPAVAVSAKTGRGLDELKCMIDSYLNVLAEEDAQ
jgi:GTP-binding protein HflX